MPDLRKRKFKLLRKRPPRPLPPTGAQVAYLAELKAMMLYARALVHARLLARLKDIVGHEGSTKLHTDADPHGRVVRLMNQVEAAFARKFPPEKLAALAQRIARSTSEHQKGQLFRQIRSTVGIDLKTIKDAGLSARVKRFTAENVALIKSVPKTYFEQVEKSVLAGMRSGKRAPEIADDMEERAEVAMSRATLIARDQVLKFNGELNQARQTELGIERYIWRTVKDNRVREEHADLEGETFSWDAPPEPGHPGEDYNCRCFAEPLML